MLLPPVLRLEDGVVGVGEHAAEPVDQRLYVEHRLPKGLLIVEICMYAFLFINIVMCFLLWVVTKYRKIKFCKRLYLNWQFF